MKTAALPANGAEARAMRGPAGQRQPMLTKPAQIAMTPYRKIISGSPGKETPD